MGMTKDTKAASERLLNINWRGEEIDSTRNPVVEAHQQAMADEQATSVPTDLSVRPQSQAAQSLKGFADTELLESDLAEIFGAETQGLPDDDLDAPELVADQSNFLDAGAKLTQNAHASIRLDEVLMQITPYAAMRELKVKPESLLGRTMLANANAFLSTLFLNLQADFGYSDIFTEGLDGPSADCDDVTDLAIAEVLRLQGLKSCA